MGIKYDFKLCVERIIEIENDENFETDEELIQEYNELCDELIYLSKKLIKEV